MKILVIEDHDTQRKLAEDVLSAAGHTVSGASDVGAAVTAVRDDRPDVILLDLGLPGLNGLALAQMVKSDPRLQEIAIVAVTSFPEKFPESVALQTGCDAYVVKPVNTRTPPELVAQVVRRKQKARP